MLLKQWINEKRFAKILLEIAVDFQVSIETELKFVR